jgi:molybdenum cofactor biosynthesis enzyme MoaA
MSWNLYAAGLRRVNISLDSMNPATFDQLVGGDRLGPKPIGDKVWSQHSNRLTIRWVLARLN